MFCRGGGGEWGEKQFSAYGVQYFTCWLFSFLLALFYFGIFKLFWLFSKKVIEVVNLAAAHVKTLPSLHQNAENTASKTSKIKYDTPGWLKITIRNITTDGISQTKSVRNISCSSNWVFEKLDIEPAYITNARGYQSV